VSFSNRPEGKVIQKGDLLHCDFGITYLRLNTDCQQHAYVLKDEEKELPVFLSKAFADGNRVQDVLASNFKTGKTGNEILLKSLKETKAEGLVPSIYTHPLGLYGHAAGPTIGMWDSQGGVPGTGDYKLYENTAYAIELNTTVTIPEWNKDIRIMLEEAGFWGEDGFRYVSGRQEEILIVK
jgi:Xaa-Pro aminopeptidase